MKICEKKESMVSMCSYYKELHHIFGLNFVNHSAKVCYFTLIYYICFLFGSIDMSQEKFDCLRLSCQERMRTENCLKYPVGCPSMEGYVPIGER